MITLSDPLSINEAFDFLAADDEQAWLHRVYVEPARFDAMRGERSIVVFGASGSGKTALRLNLARFARAKNLLVVDWRPSILAPGLDGSPAILTLAAEANMLIARDLLWYLAERPQALAEQRDWIQRVLASFIHQHLNEGRLEVELDRITHYFGEPDMHALLAMCATPANITHARTQGLGPEVLQAMKIVGIKQTWLMVDGLEPWADADPDDLSRTLRALLSTLSLFEVAELAIKMMVPDAIQGRVISNSLLSKRRVDPFNLTWTPAQLEQIVERRLAASLGRSIQLKQLSRDANWIDRLIRDGGGLPRGWLGLTQPLVRSFIMLLGSNADIPAPSQTLAPISILRIENNGRVLVGYHEITDLQQRDRKILQHLMNRYPFTCSRAELYYVVIKGFKVVPRENTDGWEPEKLWRGVMDTLLYRIRRAIEPDPDDPRYLITIRGQGVRLENVT